MAIAALAALICRRRSKSQTKFEQCVTGACDSLAQPPAPRSGGAYSRRQGFRYAAIYSRNLLQLGRKYERGKMASYTLASSRCLPQCQRSRKLTPRSPVPTAHPCLPHHVVHARMHACMQSHTHTHAYASSRHMLLYSRQAHHSSLPQATEVLQHGSTSLFCACSGRCASQLPVACHSQAGGVHALPAAACPAACHVAPGCTGNLPAAPCSRHT